MEKEKTNTEKKIEIKVTPTQIVLAFLVVMFLAQSAVLGVIAYKILGKDSTTNQPAPNLLPSQQQAANNGPDLTPREIPDFPELKANDHILGNKNAKILLIEYSDFECPFCARFHPTAQKVYEEYKNEIAWVYRHFPLEGLHPLATPMAQASECAAELAGESKFWDAADALFTDAPKSETAIYDTLSELGINKVAVKNCVDSDKYADRVKEDLDAGTRIGIRGTPGNVIYNTETKKAVIVAGAYPFETIKAAIEAVK